MNTKQMLLLGIPELPEAAFGGDLPPEFRRRILVRAMGIRPQKGFGLRAVLGIAAAIAIPYAAGAIAGAIASSTAIAASMPFITAALTTTAGATIGSAIVGAGLGAITSKVTGGNVGRGALMGGIGGGIGGYLGSEGIRYAAEGAAFNNNLLAAQGVPANIGSGNYGPPGEVLTTGGSPVGLSPQVDVTNLPIDPTNVGGTYDINAGVYALPPQDPVVVTDLADTISTQAVAPQGQSVYSPLQNNLDPATGIPVNPQGADPSIIRPVDRLDYGLAGNTSPGAVDPNYMGTTGAWGIPPAAEVTVTDLPAAAGAKGGWGQFSDAFKSKFTNPQAQADLTLRAFGHIATGKIMGSGLSGEEKALLAQQTAELQDLRTTNKALFDQRLQEAQSLMGESKYFDPAYFGMQAQRGVQTAGARAKRDALGTFYQRRAGLRSAEERRFDLAIATGGETAYIQGADAAQQNRIRTQQAGLSNLPTGAPSGALQYGNYVGNLYDVADKRRRDNRGYIGDMFGSFTGKQKAESMGLDGLTSKQ